MARIGVTLNHCVPLVETSLYMMMYQVDCLSACAREFKNCTGTEKTAFFFEAGTLVGTKFDRSGVNERETYM